MFPQSLSFSALFVPKGLSKGVLRTFGAVPRFCLSGIEDSATEIRYNEYFALSGLI